MESRATIASDIRVRVSQGFEGSWFGRAELPMFLKAAHLTLVRGIPYELVIAAVGGDLRISASFESWVDEANGVCEFAAIETCSANPFARMITNNLTGDGSAGVVHFCGFCPRGNVR